jgi:2-desacetyl-2-hydroxyethyl bacteriochlorophyllide A dehydrogenase
VRAVRCAENGVEVVEVERPETRDGVRISVRAAGICSSDIHLMGWGLRCTLGHEIAGHLDDGTPVAVWPLAPCGSCDRCAAGEPSQCRKATLYGITRDGGMADEIVVPASSLVSLPAGLAVGDAAFVETVACSVHALRRAGVHGGDSVAVVGAGSIGVGAAAVARHMGCMVSAAARHPAQRAAMTAFGVALDPTGEFDVVVDAAGSSSSIEACVALVRPGGTVVLVASYWEPVTFPAFFTNKEPRIIGALMHDHHHGDGTTSDLDDAARVLADMPEVSAAAITHRFPLDRARDAFATATDRAAGAIKVVLEP